MVRTLTEMTALLAVAVFSTHSRAEASSGLLTNVAANVVVQENAGATPVTLQGVVSILSLAENSSGSGVLVRALVSAGRNDGPTTPIINQVIEADAVIRGEGATARSCAGVWIDIDRVPLDNGRFVDVEPLGYSWGVSQAGGYRPVQRALCTIAKALQQQLVETPEPQGILIGLLLPAVQKLNSIIAADVLSQIPVTGQVTTPGGATAALNGILTINSVADGASNTLMMRGTMSATLMEEEGIFYYIVSEEFALNITIDAGAGNDILTLQFNTATPQSGNLTVSLNPAQVFAPPGTDTNQIIAILIGLMKQKNEGASPRAISGKIRQLNSILPRI